MSNLYQQTMQLRHCERRLEAARKREAKASVVYNRRVRETERATESYRRARRDFQQRSETAAILEKLLTTKPEGS